MSRTTLISISFFILSICCYGVIEWHQSKQQQAQDVDKNIRPDFIAETLNSESFTLAGKLSYLLAADRMEHYANLAVTHFEFPKYTLYPKNSDSPWKISANEGTLYGNQRVKLENQVRLIAMDNDSLIKEIRGKYLELDLLTNIISSNNRIEVTGEGFTMEGTGLIVDLNTKQVTLTQHERTIYQKP